MSVTELKLAYERAEPAAVEAASQWAPPLPLPSTLPDVPPFPAQLLPTQLRDWVRDIADRMQVPLDFVAIPAIVAAGSLIGRRIGIRPEAKTDWTEPANLWGAIVAPPGAMKSPALGEALAPIRRLEARAAAENEQAVSDFKKATALHKLEFEAARDRAKKEFKEGAPELARAILQDVEEPVPPREQRYMATDATVEKLGEICADNPAGILLHRDELLSMFQDLSRDEKAPARGFLLTGWSGRDGYTFERIVRGTTRVPAVNISVIGTTQPHRLATYLRESLKSHDDGMVQRLQLLAWPDHKGEWQSSDRAPNAAAKAAAFACYEQLANLEAASVGAERDPYDDGEGIAYLRFAPDALELFAEWRKELESKIRAEDMPAYFAAHLSKYRGLIPRLALIYHLASGGTGPVSRAACLAALCWSEYLEAHAERAYASMSAARTDIGAAILRRIKKGDLVDGFTARDVYRRQWTGLKDREAVTGGLALLADYDWLQAKRTLTGGRPSETFHINPAALP